MLEALHRECKDIAMLIAQELHKTLISDLNDEYHTKVQYNDSCRYIFMTTCIGGVYNYRSPYETNRGFIRLPYYSVYRNSTSNSTNSNIPLPNCYIFSSGLNYSYGYK